MRKECAGSVLAGKLAASPEVGAFLPSPLANGAVRGRRCGEVRAILARIVAVVARPVTTKRGKLREIPL
jgi:hypothetical protein